MKKRIGVFVGEIGQEYQQTIAKKITGYANPLGYDVVFICSYGSYNEDILYADGEKACMYLPDCSTFDGIIVTEDVLDIADMPDQLYKIIKETAKCPVVYLRTSREGCYSVLIEDKASIELVAKHFVEDHGFTDICYMSGKKGADDARDRLAGFTEVMESHGIEVNDHMIFHGDYWRYKGKEAVDWFMEGRTTYPQAIICANDYMALSVCEELRSRGVRVPEDVCVSGFDFVDEAKANIPTLTTLEVDFDGIIRRAVEIIDGVNHGDKVEKTHRIPAKLRLHKSCGCGQQYEFKNLMSMIGAKQRHIDDTKNTLLSVTDYQDRFEFDEYMAVAYRYRRFIRSEKTYFCFCDSDESGFGAVENDSLFTQRMIMRMIFDGDKPAEKAYITFPRKKLLPDEYWEDDKPNNICLFSIHFKNMVYGYMVAKMPEAEWFDIYTQGYLMTLANAIENGEVHTKMEHLEAIRAIYQKDELTGILNRRGFDKMFQERYLLVHSEGKHIGLASIDMDNLKTINDTYGHAEGDKSLIILAKALSSVMRDGDFCARIGGDEFAAVIDVAYPGRCNEFRKEFLDALKRESMKGSQYLVEASVGLCESTDHEAVSMVSCIQIADKRMYEEKRGKKSR